ncbi:NACHT domain-containing protein [Lutibacter sp.]
MDKVVNQGKVKIENQNIYYTNETERNIYDNLEFSEEFQKYIDNIGINLIHSDSNKDIIEFDDLYTPPDLKPIEQKQSKKRVKFQNLSDIIIEDGDDFNFVLLGDDISGKSASVKFLTKWFYFKGYIPILLNGKDIKNNIRLESVIKKIKSQFDKQFSTELSFETILENDTDKFIIIIDDFHLTTRSKSNYWYYLITNIKSKFKNVILTGKQYMPMETILSQSKKPVNIFEEFDVYLILEFGPKLRYSITNRWNKLGFRFPDLEKDKLIEKNDIAIKRMEQIIGKGYIPSYPFYILTLLQTFESQSVINRPQYSIHGFYYELLINNSLSKAVKDSDEIGVFNNLLSHIAYYFFINRTTDISKVEFENILLEFAKKIDIEEYNTDNILETLSNAKLIIVEDSIYFYPQYIYYFYVAKYLSNHLNSNELNIEGKPISNEIKEIIKKLSKRLYREEFSSIIIFLTHLSKDKFIIEELLSNAKNIFKSQNIAKLEEDIKKINELVKELPSQVLELMSVDEARDEQLDFQEEIEQIEKEIEEDDDISETYDFDEDISNLKLFEEITLSLKTIDILGQIAKKYWGELSGETKYNLTSETYFVGLRTLSLMVNIMLNDKEGIKELLKSSIEKQLLKNKRISHDFEIKDIIEDKANKFLFNLSFLTSWGIIKRISGAIGSKKISNTLKKVVDNNPYNSVKLIDVSIKLDYKFPFPWQELDDKKYILPNKMSSLLKQNLIMHYLYLYETDNKKKMQIANKYKIEVKQQVLIDGTSRIKRKSKR